MWQELWSDAVIPGLVTVMGAVLTTTAAYAARALRRWGDKQKAAWVGAVLDEAAMAAERAVATVNQTFVDGIKAASEDGQLTAADAREAANRALAVALDQLGQDGLKALIRVVGSMGAAQRTLQSLIEAKVGEANQQRLVGPKMVLLGNG